jgi:predicted DCC family thiol-disulfide oxidoreductase YuxK
LKNPRNQKVEPPDCPESQPMLTATNSLPSIDQLPNADVVLYDGDCVFCTTSVQQLTRLDGKNRLAFLSIHDPRVQQRYPDLQFSQLMEQMYLVPADHPEKRYGGAAAVRYLTRRLPRLWVLAPLLHLPGSLPVWQWLYRQVAIRRYRIANRQGKLCDQDGSCQLHFKQKNTSPKDSTSR